MKRARLRADISTHRLLMAAMWLRLLTEKANFDPGQPRVPVGDPAGGQWTGDGGGNGTASGTHRTRRYKGKLPPHTPPGANVDQNMKEPESHKLNFLWFYDQVHNKGTWDYKQIANEYDEFGNFNYGATGRAAGFSEDTLLRAAGWAQVHAGTSQSDWGIPINRVEALLGIGGKAPFGDDPNDQVWIKPGFEYYDAHK
jgi:hypothetical protein